MQTVSFVQEDAETLLRQGAEQLGLALSSEQLAQLLAYHQLLVKWNQAYNLTAVRDPLEMVRRHLVDSLSILPYLQDLPTGSRVLDVGSGGGMPGVMMAIMRPDLQLAMLDSNGKKTRFLSQVKLSLALSFEVLHQRLEHYQPEQGYDLISCRAFSSLPDLVNWSQQCLQPEGAWLAMKGQAPSEELANLPSHVVLDWLQPLQVPYADGARHLVRLVFAKG